MTAHQRVQGEGGLVVELKGNVGERETDVEIHLEVSLSLVLLEGF